MNTGPETAPEPNQLTHQETVEEAQATNQDNAGVSEPSAPPRHSGARLVLAAIGGGFLGALALLAGLYLISRDSVGWLNSADNETRQQLGDLRDRYKQLEGALRQQPAAGLS